MRAHSRFVILLVLASCFWGCGGSGSSGFDAAPITEDAAIQLALDTQRCVANGSLTICPASAPSGAPERVDVQLGSSDAIPCTAGAGECAFLLPFMPSGFPPTAVFGVAVRTVAPPGPWQISTPLAAPATPDEPGLEAPVSIGSDMPLPPDTEVQLAVVVFLSPPQAAFPPLDVLGKSGAAFAFVIAPRPLEVVGGTPSDASL